MQKDNRDHSDPKSFASTYNQEQAGENPSSTDMETTGATTPVESTAINNSREDNSFQNPKKRPASDSNDMESPPVSKKAKQDNTLAPRLDSPTAGYTDDRAIRRGDHMARDKAAIDGEDTAAVSKKRKKERRTRFNSKGNEKNAPYFGVGVQFRWSDNATVSKSKAKLNDPQPSLFKIKLTDTKGKVWPSAKFMRHATMVWTDKNMIRDLNKWRSQFISRTLDKNNSAPKSTRPRWTSSEMCYMAMLIKKAINRKQGRLTKADWIGVAKRMNIRFKGTTAKKGEQIPDTLNAKKTLVKSSILKKDHIIPERSVNTMKNQATRWPEVVRMMADELDAISSSSSDEDVVNPGSGKGSKKKTGAQNDSNMARAVGRLGNLAIDSDSGSDRGLSSGSGSGGDTTEEEENGQIDIGNGLEDDSDDQMDDQRPASNPTGAILITA